MKKLAFLPMCFSGIFAVCTSHAVDLKQSKLTQVVNDVQIISAADQRQKAAALNDIFSMPDILRTGTASRAELVALDETVTRVGANTIFSFDPANRTIDLKQGSLLFHAPHGKGGGTIHTGSATASVLGTTLIVTTTPNGGFKVLDLEGEVEVKFLNGLKQKLDPGQMTFILPGGNQLAPVIIFRLDELTQNSLLVKGFNQSLDSLPLIKNQIEKQIKQIQSGKASDTGLYAGEDAGPDHVQVLDINTISHSQQTPPPPPPPSTPLPLPPAPHSLTVAEAADATINQSLLTDASVPTPPWHVFLNPKFPLTGNSFLGGQTFSGFVARNIFMNTPAASLNPLTVNLSSFNSLATFDLVAVQDISIEGPITFSGLPVTTDLSLIAGHQFNLTPGVAVRADVHNLLLSSPATMLFDDVSVFNLARDINLNSGADVSFQNGSLISAASRLIVNAANDITAAGSYFIGDSATFWTLDGAITFDSTSVNASGHAVFIAPKAINLNNSTISSDFVALNGTAAATISIDKTTINAPTSLLAMSVGDLNITGSTLTSDAASGNIALASAQGSATITGTAITAHTFSVAAAGSILFDGADPTVLGKSALPASAQPPVVSARYLKLNSGDGILLAPNGRSLIAGGAGATASFTAGFATGNSINVNNTDFSSFAAVNMAANTINLANVAFGGGSSVTLRSLNGELAPNPNTGAASVPGDVNFIQNVTYGGNPAQNYVGSGITIGELIGPLFKGTARGF